MDSVDVWDSPLIAYELEVDQVNNWPHLPRSLTGREKIILDLLPNDRERVPVDQAKIGEEDRHEDRTPEELVDGHFREDGDGIRAWNLLVEPIVEVVTRWTVVDEAEEGEGGKTLVVDGSSSDEDLMNVGRLVMTNEKRCLSQNDE